MPPNRFLQKLNLLHSCKEYNLPLYQCPQFLFMLMGSIIIASQLLAYVLASRFIQDPLFVALLVIALTLILLIIAFIITQSFEKLAYVARMKSDFVSITSHQLRSPLTNLKWAADTLTSEKLGQLPPKQLEYINIIKENTERMRKLIADLATITKIENNELSFKKEEFLLPQLVKAILEDFQPMAKACNIVLEPRISDDLLPIFSDYYRIKEVLSILVDNAIRYTLPIQEQSKLQEDSKRKVIIEVKKKRGNIFFAVQDFGVGIPKNERRFVFSKFFRARNIMRYQTQGNGLGLFIAKAIVKKAGGKIGFKTEENKGSTFWFTIPTK